METNHTGSVVSQRGLTKETKTNQSNKPNQSPRIGRQDRSPVILWFLVADPGALVTDPERLVADPATVVADPAVADPGR